MKFYYVVNLIHIPIKHMLVLLKDLYKYGMGLHAEKNNNIKFKNRQKVQKDLMQFGVLINSKFFNNFINFLSIITGTRDNIVTILDKNIKTLNKIDMSKICKDALMPAIRSVCTNAICSDNK